VLGAWPDAAEQLDGIGETIRHLLSVELRRAPLLTNPALVVDYLLGHAGRRIAEQVIALYLDGAGYLMRDEVVSVGSISRAPIHPREIVRRALELGSTSIIVAHNHPGGDPSPSEQDILVTRDLAAAAKLFEIELFDHFIVARTGWTSLRAEGLI
jgi:DNA repair protein RadC